MRHVRLLDCTLRDGAYVIDKKFGDNTIKGIISGLIDARTDLIEIGFLQDEGFGEGKTVFKNSVDAAKFIPEDKKGILFTVLADVSRYSIENLDAYNGKSFDAVRACFFKHERYEAIEFFKEIKKKGYKLFVQPVDVLGYSDAEMLELIELINDIEPYCFSIVDTFGSMYKDDLHRIFYLINNNLVQESKIGFHSHNNLQLSNALTQEFVNISYGNRDVIVDATISGMGRGAGNTPTELIAQYMVNKLGYNYDIDAILDVIDNYVEKIHNQAQWGYTTSMFLAGCYSAHVNNITYLQQKNSIKSKDLRYILNKVGAKPRKRYDYDLLEKVYVEYMHSEIDDTYSFEKLKKLLQGKNILLLAPGKSSISEEDNIKAYIKANNAIVISVNFNHKSIDSDYIYMSNVKRYSTYDKLNIDRASKYIFTSNVKSKPENDDEFVVSFSKLIKCGWEYMDNSSILLLRLLNILEVNKIGIAGLDGYEYSARRNNNYSDPSLEVYIPEGSAVLINKELREMLEDFMNTKNKDIKVEFVTNSRFKGIL